MSANRDAYGRELPAASSTSAATLLATPEGPTDTVAGAFTPSGLAPQDPAQAYFSDAFIGRLGTSAMAAMPQLAARGPPEQVGAIPGPVLSLAQARDLIQKAFSDFDDKMGQDAARIFSQGFDAAAARAKGAPDWDKVPLVDPPQRWRIQQATGPMQRSMPAQSPKGLDPANPNPYSIIDFQFNGGINSVVYLAHELGHSIADDNLQSGGKYGSGANPAHMAETQAYLAQCVLYSYIARHPDLDKTYPGLVAASQAHFSATMAQNLEEIPVALNALAARRDGAAADTQILQQAFGPGWKSFPGAETVSGAIADAADGDAAAQKKADSLLDDRISRLQGRAPSLLAAVGLFNAADRASKGPARAEIVAQVMSGEGPLPLSGILKAQGIDTHEKLAGFTADAVSTATSAAPFGDAPAASRYASGFVAPRQAQGIVAAPVQAQLRAVQPRLS